MTDTLLPALSKDQEKELGINEQNVPESGSQYHTYSTTDMANRLSSSYLTHSSIDRQQGVDSHNLAKVVNIDTSTPFSKDQQNQAQTNFDLQKWASTDWMKIATDLPATSNVASNPISLSAVKPNLGFMGMIESAFQNWKNAGEYNRYSDLQQEYALKASRTFDPDQQKYYTGLAQFYQNQAQSSTTNENSLPFMARQTGHFFTGMAISAAKGVGVATAINSLREIPANAALGAELGGGLTAEAGGVGAIPGYLAGAGIGIGKAFLESLAPGITMGIAKFNVDQLTAASYMDQINKGAPANNETKVIANGIGLALGIAQQKVMEVGLNFGLKSILSPITSKSIPFLENLGEKIPFLKHVSDGVKLDPESVIGKPLGSVIGTFTKNLMTSSAALGSDLYIQNLAINIASNKSLADSGQLDKLQSFSDTLKNSTEGIGRGILQMSPLLFLSAGGAALGQSIRNSEIQSNTLKTILDSAKKNDNYDHVPDINSKFHEEAGRNAGVSHIQIDLSDANEILKEHGTDAQTAFETAGLSNVYQTAMENSDQFANVPIGDIDKIAKIEIAPGKTMGDILQDSMRLGEDQFTKNQSREVDRITDEEKKKSIGIESLSPDDKIIHDEISDRLYQRAKEAHSGIGLSQTKVAELARTETDLVMAGLRKEQLITGKSMAELKEKYLYAIEGPLQLSPKDIKARKDQALLDIQSEEDPGTKIVNYGKPIYIDSKVAPDFKDTISKYPKGTFTYDKTKGVPWEQSASEMFGTIDQKEVQNKLDSAKFHSKKEINAEVEKRVYDQLESEKRFKYQPKPGEALGMTDFKEKVIRLFKGHNQSTFMHEMAHVFLQNKFDFARSGVELPEEFAHDWEILKKELGITDEHTSLTEDQHEMFAKGFERYLWEGESPSHELKPIFAKFQRWMMNIYKMVGIKGISPELKGVFDRMFATQAEIDQVKADMGYNFIRREFEAAGYDKRTVRYLERLFRNGEVETARRAMAMMREEFDSKWQKSREKFKQGQYDEKNPDSVASKMWADDNRYAFVDAMAISKDENKTSATFEERQQAFEELKNTAQDVLNGGDPDQLMGVDIYFDTNNPIDTAKAILSMNDPKTELDSRAESATQEKYPIQYKAEYFHDKIIQMYHNTDTLKALLAQKEAFDALAKERQSESVKNTKETEQEKAKNKLMETIQKFSDKLDEQKSSMKEKFKTDKEYQAWKKDQEINQIMYSGLWREMELKEKLSEMELRKKAEDWYAKAFEKLQKESDKEKSKHIKEEHKKDIDFERWKSEQSTKEEMYRQLFDQADIKKKFSDKEMRQSAEKLYDKLFLESAQADIWKYYVHLGERIRLIQESAKRIIADMPVSEIKRATRTLITAERNAAILADRYFKAGNVEKACDSKRNQVMAHAKLSEAIKAQKFVDKAMGKLDTAQILTPKDLKKMVHFDALVDLLHKFGLTNSKEKSAKEGTLQSWTEKYQGVVKQRPQSFEGEPLSFKMWVDSFNDPTLDTVFVADWLQDENLSRNINDLKIGELRDLTDAISNIRQFANTEQLFKLKNKREFMDQVVSSIRDFSTKHGLKIKDDPMIANDRRVEIGMPSTMQIIRRTQDSIKSYMIDVARMCEAFGANVEIVDNPIFQHIFQRIADCSTEFLEDHKSFSKELLNNINGLDLKKMVKTYIDEDFGPRTSSKISLADVLMMAHHMGTDSNFDRLVSGLNTLGKTWTREDIETLVSKHMTNEMWDTVEKNWNTINKLWTPARETYERIYGVSPEKIEGRTFKMMVKVTHEEITKNGKTSIVKLSEPRFKERYIEGQYCHIGNEPALNRKGLQNADTFDKPIPFDNIDVISHSPINLLTPNGAMIERNANANHMIDLDITRLQSHTQSMLRDIHYREALIDINNMISRQDFKNMWVSKHGEEGYGSLRDWLEKQATDGRQYDGINRVLDKLTNNSTYATLAHSFFVASGDFATNALIVAPQIGPIRALKAFAKMIPTSGDLLVMTGKDIYSAISKSSTDAMSDPKTLPKRIQGVFDRCPRMEQRFNTRTVELANMLTRGSIEESHLQRMWKFGIFEWAQAATEIPIYEEAEARALKAGYTPKQAAEIGSYTVEKHFGSGRIENRSEILSAKSGWIRAMNQFCTFTYAQFGNLYLAEQRFEQGTLSQKMNALCFVAAVGIVSPMVAAIAGFGKPNPGQSTQQWLAEEVIAQDLRMIPFINMGSRALATIATGDKRPVTSNLRFTGALDVLDKSIKALHDSFTDKPTDEKVESWTKVAPYVIGSIPYLNNIPYSNSVNNLFWNVYEAMVGKTKFEFRDLMSRRPKNERQ